MRRVCLVAALWLAGACTDEDAKRPEPAMTSTDAGVKPASDAGQKTDAAKPASKLEKPGALPRVPQGLPDDLRPPR